MVWRPFMRQMREIVETCSILGTRIRQRMAGTAERICTKFTGKTCLVLRSYDFECQGQRSRSPGIKNALCTQHPAVWTEWNALVVDNVAHAADATIALGIGLHSDTAVDLLQNAIFFITFTHRKISERRSQLQRI